MKKLKEKKKRVYTNSILKIVSFIKSIKYSVIIKCNNFHKIIFLQINIKSI